MNNFSFYNRKNIKDDLKNTQYDLLVIGGGITGAGIALDAASRGMKVALIEKNDFASGTSSKSTKLIHGGLRYLKQFDFWLVKEVGTERAIVHKLAPHLVIPEKMILPLIDGGTYGSWLTSIGLKVYDILASVDGDDKRKMLNKKEALEKEPLLPKKKLNGAGYYAEYRTDDSRLTIEVLKTANQYEAQIINYTKAIDFIYKKKKVTGVKVKDTLSDEKYNINAKYVVNACGPWVDNLRELNKSNIGSCLYLTKGVHLVVPYEKLPIKKSVYFDIPDGRMMFAIPRGKTTYFGTTDTHYTKDIDCIKTDLVDAMYLISAVNNMFPNINLSLDDIESSWAGLRPLINEKGKTASELSRKDEIFISDTDLISIAGGKLTGYRKMSERVVNIITKKYKKKYNHTFNNIQTEKIILSGGPFQNFNAVKKYSNQLKKQFTKKGLSDFDIDYLVHNYGKQSDIILSKFNEFNSNNINENIIKAEIWFTINHEMVVSPIDFLIRRTGRLYFNKTSVEKFKDLIILEFQTYFNWNDLTTEKHKKELIKAIKTTVNFK